jgi:hypothetical protein
MSSLRSALRALAATGSASALLAGIHGSQMVNAQGGTQLYLQAARDVAQLHQYVEREENVETGSRYRATYTLIDEYDEQHNREQADQRDVESVKSAQGWRTGQYDFSIIMLNHTTYVRSSRNKSGWTMHAGFGYVDPYTKNHWFRAAPDWTKFRATFSIEGKKGNGTILLAHGKHVTGKVEVMVSNGATPRILEIRTSGTVTSKFAGKVKFVNVNLLTNFDQPLSIVAPRLGT